MEDSREELEKILDEGIASYCNAEPLLGMKGRILERIHLTARRSAVRADWRTALIYGLAALVIAGFITVLMRHGTPEPSTNTPTTKSPPVQQNAQIQAHTLAKHRVHMRRQVASAAVKQQVFPTPSPLTREEHLLQLLSRTNSPEVAQAFDALRKDSKPIEVSPIAIAPLTGGDGQ